MDGTISTTTRGQAATWLELEQPVCDTRLSVMTLSVLIEDVLQSKHPGVVPWDGYRVLLVSEDMVRAMNYMVANVLRHSREAEETFHAAWDNQHPAPRVAIQGEAQPAHN